MMTRTRAWRVGLLVGSLLWLIATMLPAAARADGASFTWRAYTLTVESIRINPDNVVDNPDPGGTQYVLIRLVSADAPVPIGELVEYLDQFYLVGADGQEYPQNAFMPYAMAYNERNRVFMQSMNQPKFDIFFVLPTSQTIDTFTFYADEAAISLGDPAVVGVTQ